MSQYTVAKHSTYDCNSNHWALPSCLLVCAASMLRLHGSTNFVEKACRHAPHASAPISRGTKLERLQSFIAKRRAVHARRASSRPHSQCNHCPYTLETKNRCFLIGTAAIELTKLAEDELMESHNARFANGFYVSPYACCSSVRFTLFSLLLYHLLTTD